jgi:hypothetical protein
MPQMPFDDAMKRILAAPPQRREAQEKRQSGNKKTRRSGFLSLLAVLATCASTSNHITSGNLSCWPKSEMLR